MLSNLVILALCVLSSTGLRWNQYKTVLSKGTDPDYFNTNLDRVIPSGQCNAVYTNNLCDPGVAYSLRVTVKDNYPYPEVTFSNDLTVISIKRNSYNDGGCYDTASVLVEAACATSLAKAKN